ncbi:MAG: hypothetical protein CMI00_01510 [Oceanospirillaceae bacterium]|nr:hypothetical protein [Oceanospirillaceae bacterium]
MDTGPDVNSQDFINLIKDELSDGYGFCPLIGSGISYASGIITGHEIRQYLLHVTFKRLKALEIDGNKSDINQESNQYNYNLEKYGWPEKPDSEQLKNATEWFQTKYDEALNIYKPESGNIRCFNEAPAYPDWIPRIQSSTSLSEDPTVSFQRRYDRADNKFDFLFTPRPGVSRHSNQYFIECALRATFDWRACLQFHSRLKIIDGLYTLENSADQSIIDSMNVLISKGKKPNLAHYTLAYLTMPLRIRKILTTNFDHLIEDTFYEISQPIDVYSVERNSRLPDALAVSQRLTMIKMHGSLHETRADYSLDEAPTSLEKSTFRNYFLPSRKHGYTGVTSHSIVLGYSFLDKRTLELIKFTLDSSKQIKIFYIGYNKQDLDSLYQIFEPEYHSRIIATQTKRLDLLLLDIFSSITFSLPPGGFTHQYTQYVAPAFKIKESQTPGTALGDIEYRIEVLKGDIERNCKNEESEIFINRLENSGTYLTSRVYYEIEKTTNINCHWFETDDYANPISLLIDVIKVLSIRKGIFHSEHFDHGINLNPEEDITNKKISELIKVTDLRLKIMGINTSGATIFINGRNIHGRHSKYDPVYQWKATYQNNLQALLEILHGVKINVVHSEYTSNRIDSHRQKSISLGIDPIEITEFQRLNPTYNEKLKIVQPTSDEHHKTSIDDKIEHISQEYRTYKDNNSAASTSYLRLIHSLTLFRESRNISSLFSPSIYTGPTILSESKSYYFEQQEVLNIVDNLIEKEIFYRKQGGYLWMKTTDKHYLNGIIRKKLTEEKIASPSSPLHFEIGEWYIRAFYSSNHIAPLISAIYHKISCFRELKPSDSDYPARKHENFAHLLICSLSSIIKIIKVSHKSKQFWLADTEASSNFSVSEVACGLGFNKSRPLDDDAIQDHINSKLGTLINVEYFDDIANKTKILIKQVFTQFSKLNSDDSNLNFKPETYQYQIPYTKTYDTHSAAYSPKWENPLNKKDNKSESYINQIHNTITSGRISLDFFANDPYFMYLGFKEFEVSLGLLFGRARYLTRLSRTMKCPIITGYSDANSPFHAAMLTIIRPSTKSLSSDDFNEIYQPAINTINEVKSLWEEIDEKASYYLDFLKVLDPVFFEKEQNFALRTLVHKAIANCKLGRFPLAHSLLNQASAIQFISNNSTTQDNQALIHLRRSELYMQESRNLKTNLLILEGIYKKLINHKKSTSDGARKSDIKSITDDIKKIQSSLDQTRLNEMLTKYSEDGDLNALRHYCTAEYEKAYRKHVSLLDNSSISLDAAESLLAGRSHSSKWWTRLYIERFSVISAYYINTDSSYAGTMNPSEFIKYNTKIGTAFRLKALDIDYLSSTFRKALAVTSSKDYLRIVLINAYILALKNIINYIDIEGDSETFKSHIDVSLLKRSLSDSLGIENEPTEQKVEKAMPSLADDENNLFRKNVVSICHHFLMD